MQANRFIVLIPAVIVSACSSQVSSPILPVSGAVAAAPTFTQPTFTTYAIADVDGMIAGHDGNMWFFTRQFASTQGQYGRITPGGAVLSMPIPDSTQQGLSITPNPDGNVYLGTGDIFDITQPCHIYQVHPDMSVADLIGPFACSLGNAPERMLTGYDQRLWFVGGANYITRVTTSGVVTTLTMPSPLAKFMIRGPSSGRAMYVEGGQAVYRVAPDDSITSAPITFDPGAVVDNLGIIWGADWTSYNSGQIVRMDDSLNYTLIPFTNNRRMPSWIMNHNGTLIMPCVNPPDEFKIYRFNMSSEKPERAWTSPTQYTQSAAIGPDHNLWLSDGSNVYVGAL